MGWVTTALLLVALTGVCVFSKKELDPSEILLNSLPPKQVSCILLRKHLSIAYRTKCTKLERNLKYMYLLLTVIMPICFTIMEMYSVITIYLKHQTYKVFERAV